MKKNLTLIVGLALPIVFILIIAISIAIPKNFVNPAHNFIYTEPVEYYNFKNFFDLEEGKLVLKRNSYFTDEMLAENSYWIRNVKEAPKLYLYDVEKDASYEISFTDAQNYNLVAGPDSPDGYSVTKTYTHVGIFEIFGRYDDRENYFLTAPSGKSKKILNNLFFLILPF